MSLFLRLQDTHPPFLSMSLNNPFFLTLSQYFLVPTTTTTILTKWQWQQPNFVWTKFFRAQIFVRPKLFWKKIVWDSLFRIKRLIWTFLWVFILSFKWFLVQKMFVNKKCLFECSVVQGSCRRIFWWSIKNHMSLNMKF